MTRAYPPVATPERYLSALGDHDPIDSLRKAPKRLKKALKGVGKKDVARRPADGKWSIKEVVAHLADGEVVLGARMRMVAAMERPTLTGYDQDAFVQGLCYDEVSVEQLLAEFAATRKANVALLERLPEAALSRVGVHSERGDESLATMVFMYAGHDRMHEAQIERTLKQLEELDREESKRKRLARKQAKEQSRHGRKSAKRRKSEVVDVAAADGSARNGAVGEASDKSKRKERKERERAERKDKKKRKAKELAGAAS